MIIDSTEYIYFFISIEGATKGQFCRVNGWWWGFFFIKLAFKRRIIGRKKENISSLIHSASTTIDLNTLEDVSIGFLLFCFIFYSSTWVSIFIHTLWQYFCLCYSPSCALYLRLGHQLFLWSCPNKCQIQCSHFWISNRPLKV